MFVEAANYGLSAQNNRTQIQITSYRNVYKRGLRLIQELPLQTQTIGARLGMVASGIVITFYIG